MQTLNNLATLGEQRSKVNANFVELDERVAAVELALGAVNQVPTSPAVASTATDAAGTVTGNVVTGATDADGDTMAVSMLSYKAVGRALGVSFATDYGTMVMGTNGAWTYSIGAAGRALLAGQSAVESFTFRLTDARGGTSNSTALTVTLTGTDHGPIATPDSGIVRAGETLAFNVLGNDVDPEGAALAVTGFSVAGQDYSPGATATISAGVITMNSLGVGSYAPAGGFSGLAPLVSYTVSDGTSTPTVATLTLAVLPADPTYQETIDWFRAYRAGDHQPEVGRIATNPPQARALPTFGAPGTTYPAWDWKLPLPTRAGVDGTSLDFRVGPGKEYAELGDIPWLTLRPGDRIFVFWRAEPYHHVIPVQVRGDPLRWIEVIGLRGPSGQLPILDGEDAYEPSSAVFNDTFHRRGLINAVQPLDGRAHNTYKPSHWHIHGLEIRNAKPSNSMTNYLGVRGAWGGFASAFTGMGYDHITISGCHFHDNANGAFTNTNPLSERFTSRYTHWLFNLFEQNSLNQSFHVHNIYTEGWATIFEFNVFRSVVDGSYGDLLKDRSSGNIFRYNSFDLGRGQNCIGIRDPDLSYELGYASVDHLGANLANHSFVYSNTFVVRNTYPEAVIGHGDGLTAAHGEVRGGGSVFFYGNRVIVKHAGVNNYIGGTEYTPIPANLFAPINSRAATTFKAWNNLLYCERTVAGPELELAAFYWQGHNGGFRDNFAHNMKPVAILSTAAPLPSMARGAHYGGSLADLGITNTNEDPGFVSWENDIFALRPDSPFYDLAGADETFVTARGLSSQGEPVIFPYHDEPAPQVIEQPSFTGTAIAGNTLTGVPALMYPLPETSTYRWVDEETDEVIVTGLTWVTVGGDDNGRVVVFEHTGVGFGGTTVVRTAPLIVASTTTPQPTTAPTLSGSGQAGYAITINQGAWSNSPVAYTYQLLEVPSMAVFSSTQVTTPVTGDIGKTVIGRVRAENSIGEYNYADTAPLLIRTPALDPDGTGKFNFAAASGTSISTLSPVWQGTSVTGQQATTYLYCNGAGALVGSYVARWSGGTVWYQNGQPDSVSAEIEFTVSTTVVDWRLGVVLRAAAGVLGYSFEFTATTFRIWRLGVQVHTQAASPTGTVTLKVVPTASGVFDVYVNGSLLVTYTDPSPVTGGAPGLTLWPGDPYEQGINYWTDNPL